MPVTVLSDSQIDDLLHSLTSSDIKSLQENLASTLHDYSTGTQETSGGCAENQPQRIAIPTRDGTVLFMPAATKSNVGVKVVSLSSGESKIKRVVTQADDEAPSTRPKGTLTLLDLAGNPLALLAATTLTAFRTALATTFLFSKRSRVHNIVVFGAGAQAYWHIRLALLLRGPDVHHVHIVNRSYETAGNLFKTILKDPRWADLRYAYKGSEPVEFTVLGEDYGEYARVLKDRVRGADVIFGCTPSTKPYFPAEWLTSAEGRRRARYLGLIGSYTPGMMELHPDILRHEIGWETGLGHGEPGINEPGKSKTGSGASISSQISGGKKKIHWHKHVERSGVIVVDSLEASLKEAGEIIAAELTGHELVELGELVMVKRAEQQEIELGQGDGEESGLRKWVMGGNVIYKSVGLGIMDLCVGNDVVKMAREKKIGTTVDF